MLRIIPTLLVLGTLVSCAHTEPAPQPKRTKIDPQRVWAIRGDERNFIRYDLKPWPLRTLDPTAAARLATALFPGAMVKPVGDARRIDFDSERSAMSFVEAARWADGMILAIRTMEEQRGETPTDHAAVIFDNVRRYLLMGSPVDLPDWGAVLRALDDDDVWMASPNIAGVGALVLSGLILRGGSNELARDRADTLLGKAVALRNVPTWLSWIAQLNWVRRDFSASEESP